MSAHVIPLPLDALLSVPETPTQAKRVPSLLVSYACMTAKHVPLPGDGFDEWVLDSGAYSAHNSGKKITNEEFIAFALRAQKLDSRLRYVFALDVIGDPEASLRNAIEAKAAGVNVIPTWHAGEPVEFAKEMARQFERLACGGLVARLDNNRSQLYDTGTKVKFAEQFFGAVWPKWVHGFGCTAEDLMSGLPFASVDSTTWQLRPSMYGSWKSFGALPVRVKGDLKYALKSEVLWFLNREDYHHAQWKRELAKVNCSKFRIRLACAPSNVKLISEMFGTGRVEAVADREEAPARVEVSAPARAETVSVKTEETKPKPALTGQMDNKWADYWKSRLGTRDESFR
jgi:hypothetical protein